MTNRFKENRTMHTMRDGTLVDAIVPRPSDRTLAIGREAALVGVGVLLMALAAQVAIPWYPVPLTGGTFGALLIGGLFGFRRAIFTLGAYILVGFAGLHVFSNAGAGWDQLTGPTGGYLIGYLLAAAFVGFFADRGYDRQIASMIGVLLIANALIYAPGVAWLAAWTPPDATSSLGWSAAYETGLQPFIAGDIVKLFFAACLLPGGWALMRRIGARRRG